MHSTRACFAFITVSMKELQRKLFLEKSLYDDFLGGQAKRKSLYEAQAAGRGGKGTQASPIPKLNFSVAKEFFCSLGLGYPTTLNFKPLLRNDEGKSSVLNMGTSEASRCHMR